MKKRGRMRSLVAKLLSFREAIRCALPKIGKDYTPHFGSTLWDNFGNYDAKFLSFREAIRCPRIIPPTLGTMRFDL